MDTTVLTSKVYIIYRSRVLGPKQSSLVKVLTLKTWLLAKNYNVKKVISEVYAFLVLQCTVSGR